MKIYGNIVLGVVILCAAGWGCGGTEPSKGGPKPDAGGGDGAKQCDQIVIGEACDDGEGECRRSGIYECVDGAVVCSAHAESPRNELCDGKDNDCDGLFDEDWPDLNAPCKEGMGECEATGIIRCRQQGDGTECSAANIDPTDELCDGKDNDCDGDTDEDWADLLGTTCTTGVGECEVEGSWECAADGAEAVCGAWPPEPKVELCDGKDNNCDGETDEFWTELGNVCDVGIGECLRSGFVVCSLDGDTTRCSATPGIPSAELCDGKDNDCDTQFDETWQAELGETCSAGIGECRREGVFLCNGSGSGAECDAVAAGPQDETCDFKDNDCDGNTDEGAPGCVTTLCGDGRASAVDGRALTEAAFAGPSGVSVDDGGKVYAADSLANRIRIYDPVAATLETLAGSGFYGFASGPAEEAELRWPAGVALSQDEGILYFTDRYNHAVRAYSLAGKNVSTVAGTGSPGFQDGTCAEALFNGPFGIAVVAAGTLLVADKDNHCLRKISPVEGGGCAVSTFAGICGTSGFANGSAAAAKFNLPSSISLDQPGNVFIADSGNNRVRYVPAGVDPSDNGYVKTLAGAGAAGSADGAGASATFNAPSGIASAGLNYLYVTDSGSSRLRQIFYSDDFSSITVSTILSSGLSSPGALAVGRGGFLTVSEFTGYRLRKVNPASSSISTVAGTGAAAAVDGPRLAAEFINPSAVAVSTGGIVYVSDCGGNRVRKVEAAEVSTFIGSGLYGYLDGYPERANLRCPAGLALDQDGNLYFSDKGNHCIRKLGADAGTVTTLAGACGSAGFNNGSAGSAKFKSPSAILLDGSGNLFVADTENNRIRKIVLASGEVSTFAGQGDAGYKDGDAGSAKFNAPSGLAFETGEAGALVNLYISDTGNHAIRYYSFADGKISSLCGTEQGFADGESSVARFNGPAGIAAVRDANGSLFLFVADRGNHRVRLVDANGFVVTVAGLDEAGRADGLISDATLYSPADVAVGQDGDIYVADQDGNNVRIIVR